jgi:hypothetical protein
MAAGALDGMAPPKLGERVFAGLLLASLIYIWVG